jgi:hypothetical protein
MGCTTRMGFIIAHKYKTSFETADSEIDTSLLCNNVCN